VIHKKLITVIPAKERHSRNGGNLVMAARSKIPAVAGMTLFYKFR
jgi:hypothetical protein